MNLNIVQFSFLDYLIFNYQLFHDFYGIYFLSRATLYDGPHQVLIHPLIHPSIHPSMQVGLSPSQKWSLTVLLRLEGHLLALLLALGVGQRQPHLDGAERRQVAQREVRRVALHRQTLPHRGVVAAAASRRHGVAVAQRQGVGVAAGEVVAQRLPLQGQLPWLDLGGRQTPQGTNGLWKGRRGAPESRHIITWTNWHHHVPFMLAWLG